MKYSKDLLKGRKKSKAAIIIAVITFLVALAWVPVRFYEKGSISVIDFGYPLIMVLNGFSLTLSGIGYSPDRLFGKAYITIDDQVIKIKSRAFDKEQRIDWAEIKSIDYKPGNFTITKNDNTRDKLIISKLEYYVIQEVKAVICEIAGDKEISVNLTK